MRETIVKMNNRHRWLQGERERERERERGGGGIHKRWKRSHEVEERQHQEQKQSVVVEDGEGCCLRISNLILLPRHPAMHTERERERKSVDTQTDRHKGISKRHTHVLCVSICTSRLSQLC